MSWGERAYEVPWLLTKVMPGNVLDIGAAESCYVNDLIKMGHTEIVLNDIREFKLDRPEIKCVVGDIRKVDPKTLGLFDNVLCISTLEHMALHAYEQKADWAAAGSPASEQLNAFRHMMQFVKPSGQMILTVPYGKYEHGGWVITYDAQMIHNIKQGFKVLEEVYFTLTDRDQNTYQLVTASQCPLKGMDAYPSRGMRAWSVACLRLTHK